MYATSIRVMIETTRAPRLKFIALLALPCALLTFVWRDPWVLITLTVVVELIPGLNSW